MHSAQCLPVAISPGFEVAHKEPTQLGNRCGMALSSVDSQDLLWRRFRKASRNLSDYRGMGLISCSACILQRSSRGTSVSN
jgi:hypothetical protein